MRKQIVQMYQESTQYNSREKLNNYTGERKFPVEFVFQRSLGLQLECKINDKVNDRVLILSRPYSEKCLQNGASTFLMFNDTSVLLVHYVLNS